MTTIADLSSEQRANLVCAFAHNWKLVASRCGVSHPDVMKRKKNNHPPDRSWKILMDILCERRFHMSVLRHVFETMDWHAFIQPKYGFPDETSARRTLDQLSEDERTKLSRDFASQSDIASLLGITSAEIMAHSNLPAFCMPMAAMTRRRLPITTYIVVASRCGYLDAVRRVDVFTPVEIDTAMGLAPTVATPVTCLSRAPPSVLRIISDAIGDRWEQVASKCDITKENMQALRHTHIDLVNNPALKLLWYMKYHAVSVYTLARALYGLGLGHVLTRENCFPSDAIAQAVVHAHSAAVAVAPGPAAAPDVPLVQADESGMCVICMDAKRAVVFMPCAHMIACSACAEDIKTRAGSRCPTCRQDIAQMIKPFMS